ncbi:MAG TPA: hypothetical protein VGA67_05855 [Candidatus Dojkabacteria bacterium]|jgi:hypothetical protein
MNKKFILLFIVIIGIATSLASAGVFILNKEDEPEESIHLHAGFIVVIDEEQIDFSSNKYMHINPCTIGDDHGHELTDEEIQEEKAHMHDNIGDVVHVHQSNAFWKDLFINIDFEFPENIRGYVNGEIVENILEYPILSYDRVLIIDDDSELNEEYFDLIPEKNRIIEVENMSENCGV